MANEATLIYELGPAIPFTVADGTGIAKGAILKMADPMTASIATAQGDVVAGIAATEKIANDGVTKLGVFRTGIFKVYASGSVTAGDPLMADPAPVSNYVAKAATNNEHVIGIALETATVGESFLMELKPTSMELA
jgi:hypothetical protein